MNIYEDQKNKGKYCKDHQSGREIFTVFKYGTQIN